MAAGFDKNAEVIAPLSALGFGFVEVGTVTPKPQAGNDKPRVFRAPHDGAIINRMGFPNAGLAAFLANVRAFRQRFPQSAVPLGLNIGMNKDQPNPDYDYILLISELAGFADYLCINISSPNTPGLRNLQEPANLLPFLTTLKAARDAHPTRPPLLLKLAPDLDDAAFADIIDVASHAGVDGFVLTNTTLARPDHLPEKFRAEKGGLSGPPVREMSTMKIRHAYALTQGRVPIIGLGGVASGADAYVKIRAGASLVQLYTALVYQGPGLIERINKELIACLQRDGFKTITEAIGADHKSSTSGQPAPKKAKEAA
jgi:dihydroorotate dehydrogenase